MHMVTGLRPVLQVLVCDAAAADQVERPATDKRDKQFPASELRAILTTTSTQFTQQMHINQNKMMTKNKYTNKKQMPTL